MSCFNLEVKADFQVGLTNIGAEEYVAQAR